MQITFLYPFLRRRYQDWCSERCKLLQFAEACVCNLDHPVIECLMRPAVKASMHSYTQSLCIPDMHKLCGFFSLFQTKHTNRKTLYYKSQFRHPGQPVLDWSICSSFLKNKANKKEIFSDTSTELGLEINTKKYTMCRRTTTCTILINNFFPPFFLALHVRKDSLVHHQKHCLIYSITQFGAIVPSGEPSC